MEPTQAARTAPGRTLGLASAGDQPVGSTRSRLEAFDGLRAIAAGLVLAYHLGGAAGVSRIHVLEPFVAELKAGVTIFFVISGFLLYLPYARAIRSGGPLPNWRRFANRRAVRILPAYWVALTVVAVAPFANEMLSLNWWRYYGLVQIYHPSTAFGGIGVAWSLCVEVSFYAVLPAFAWGVAKLTRRRRPGGVARIQLIVIAALGLGALAVRFGLTHSITAPVGPHGAALAASLPGLLDWFAIGLGLAVIASEWEAGSDRFHALRAMVARPGGCWLLAGFFFAAAITATPSDTFLPCYGLLTHVAIGLSAGVFVLPAIRPATVRRPAAISWLANPRMAWLGTISYGIYLWHVWLLRAIYGPLGHVPAHPRSIFASVALAAVAVAGAVVLGAASWYLIERPAQQFLNRRRRTARAFRARPRHDDLRSRVRTSQPAARHASVSGPSVP